MIEKTIKNIIKYDTPRCAIEIATIPSEKSFVSKIDSIEKVLYLKDEKER